MTLKSGMTRAQDNRRIRQEALREQLEKQGHLQHVVDLLKKADDLDEELDQIKLQRIKLSIETRLALIKKYLPDAKEQLDVNLGGQENNPLRIKWAE